MTKQGTKPFAQAVPRATYRLQLNREFTLRQAIERVPCLHELGVSHVYASPLLRACAGSMHGYDVCDCSQLNPEIGTEAELESLVAALRAHDMGLVLDIVPNHMAASQENPWWWDVLKNGPASRFADYFDIDWHSAEPGLRGKVLLPVLGDEFERVLERGELTVGCEQAEVTVRYFEHRFPVDPQSILVPHKFLEEAVRDFNADSAALARFLDRQHYRLAFWRHGDSRLNYRRFFTITHLAGVRVERPQVFADTHNRILDWHQRGLLDGLRIDHPDGLRDPRDYLERLQQAAPGAWIVVEKILEPGSPRGVVPVRSARPPEITPRGEALPSDWPVAGTTGYDFLNRVGGLLIDPAAEKPLTDFYTAFTGEPADYPALMREKKRAMLRQPFATEVKRLVQLLAIIAARHPLERPLTPQELEAALTELIACFPVYRTYVRAESGEISDADKAWVSAAVAEALKGSPQPSTLPSPSSPSPPRSGGEGRGEISPNRCAHCAPESGSAAVSAASFSTTPAGRQRSQVHGEEARFSELKTPHPSPWQCQVGPALAFLRDLLEMKFSGEPESEFVMRFQQLTGPAMAKGVEDTSFYCFNRFISLNEVGGDPGHFGLSVAAFHQSCVEAAKRWPGAMLATSTHDTKRSEDVRARLALLSEIPEPWTAAVRRWSAMNEKYRRDGRPDRNAEYLFYQTLAGAWPLTVERAVAFMEKASREAKQHTNWTEPNAAYDDALKQFVTATMQDRAFMADVEKFVAQLIEPGQVNSLAQTLIKLTAPGVPDIYQGSELWDLSLVDPDNRRLVDFNQRVRLQTEMKNLLPQQIWQRRAEGLPKLWLIQKTLQFRRRHANWFSAGSDYQPLAAQGDKAAHVVAFARGASSVTLVPRLMIRLANDWADTTLVLPEGDWLNEFTGEAVIGGNQNVSELLKQFPVALLSRKENN